MKKQLIINADDFGLSAGVNRGIMELHHAGLISSSTIMVNMRGFEDAVAHALSSPELGVGLHFNLTYGSPVSPKETVETLVDQAGRFSGNVSVWDELDVSRELAAQWERLILTGIQPTHIDSHQHIQRYLSVYRPMTQLANSNQIGMRRLGFDQRAGFRHPRSPQRFILDVYFSDDGLSKMLHNLESLTSGVSELMCHPGYVDQDLRDQSGWTDVREKELQVMMHPQVKETIGRKGIEIIHYGQLT